MKLKPLEKYNIDKYAFRNFNWVDMDKIDALIDHVEALEKNQSIVSYTAKVEAPFCACKMEHEFWIDAYDRKCCMCCQKPIKPLPPSEDIREKIWRIIYRICPVEPQAHEITDDILAIVKGGV